MGASYNHYNHIDFKHEMTMSVFFYIYNWILWESRKTDNKKSWIMSVQVESGLISDVGSEMKGETGVDSGTRIISDLGTETKVERESKGNNLGQIMSVEGETGVLSEELEPEIKVEKESKGNAGKYKPRRGRPYTPSLPCKHCGKVFTRQRTMRLHIQGVHLKIKRKEETNTESKVIKCEQCDKVVKRKAELKLHNKRAHLKIKDYKCVVCSKLFSTINELTTHEVIHKEKRFSCSICGLKIRWKRSLVNHMEGRHMGIQQKQYFCQECGIHYSNTAHKLTHMDQSKLRKFTCETCGKQFVMNKNLKKHNRLHKDGRLDQTGRRLVVHQKKKEVVKSKYSAEVFFYMHLFSKLSYISTIV